MKKSLLFAVLISMSMLLAAQSIPPVQCAQDGKTEKVIYHQATKHASPFVIMEPNIVSNRGMVSPTEVEIGETFYDLQTNASIDNRFVVFDDGTMAAVWTRGMTASAFPNRGTGYNYFDGSDWGPWPDERIEDIRTGWPSIAAWGETGEIVVAHNGVSGLEWSQRDVKGSGDWTQTNFIGPAGIENDITWPRMVTSGENNEYIHLIVNSYVEYMGQARALLYSRSSDGGASWDPHNVILDGTGDEDYFQIDADGYTAHSNGNTVCFLVGGTWIDLFYMRSDDNGDNWEKHLVWEHPYPMIDPATMQADTFFCMDRTAQLKIDNQGHVHVVFALQRAISDESGYGTYAWNPDYDGIVYWNDMMEPFSNDINALAPPQLGYEGSELIEDVNYIGWMQDVDGNGVVELEGIMNYHSTGMSTMPSLAIDELGIIYVLYSSNTEGFVYSGGDEPVNYKHIWMRSYSNQQWGDFTDLTENIAHIFDECIYPVIGKASGPHLHYIYNADIAPGNGFNGDHEYHQNRTIYGLMDIATSVNENLPVDNGLNLSLSPNPVADKLNISFDINESADIRIILSSITGKQMKEVHRTNVNAGTVKIGIDVSDLPAGTYICSLWANGLMANKKLIVR
ncbi:MAG: T9SS type A sorting domain-containing protein [Bacteroidales bacterium]|nr:T9SS type A sorting domain-containing protein [Bacteroidales bacterium]